MFSVRNRREEITDKRNEREGFCSTQRARGGKKKETRPMRPRTIQSFSPSMGPYRNGRRCASRRTLISQAGRFFFSLSPSLGCIEQRFDKCAGMDLSVCAANMSHYQNNSRSKSIDCSLQRRRSRERSISSMIFLPFRRRRDSIAL